MSNEGDDISPTDTLAWAKSRLDQAVRDVTKTGIINGATVEAKVVWALPKKILIGHLRDSRPEHGELWIIAGDLPTDYIDFGTCATPRDAARHFALKWQLEAEQARDPKIRKQRAPNRDVDWEIVSNRLASMAELLYSIAREDQAWEPFDDV